MSNTIRIKKRAASGSAGAPSALAPSEIAFNENASDLKLYYGLGDDGSGEATSVIVIGGSGGFFNKTDTRTANTILSGPTTGSAAAPTFRSLVAGDIPSITSSKVSNFNTTVQANRVDQLAAATNPVTGVTPTADTHFAIKSYVDGVAQGLDIKDSVKVATTANITLSGTQTIDGVAVSADERVLVKNQSTASQNGLYLCKASTWARTDDLAAGVDAAGMFTFVEQGSTNADQGFVCSSDKGSAVVGTNNLAFTQFSGGGNLTAGDGLDKSGNEFSVDLKSNGGLVIESTELAVDLGASSITNTLAIANGGTGGTSASAARTNLGLAIGSDIQAYDAGLAAIAGLATTDGGIIVGNGSTFVLESGSTARASLGLAIGTNVQAFDAQLTDIAGLTPSDSNFIVGDGSNFVLESGSTARASLGLAIGSNVQAYDADLDNLSGCQSGGSAALAALTSTEIQILDGATVTTTQLNRVDATSSIQTQLDAKQAADADLTALSGCQSGAATALALLTATEVAILDGATLSTANLNVLDGITATTSELNLMDGGTSATSTTLATADRFVCNDAGTMKQVALSDLVTFLEDGATSGFDVEGGTF